MYYLILSNFSLKKKLNKFYFNFLINLKAKIPEKNKKNKFAQISAMGTIW